jgi:hypothetical protein
MNNSKDNKIADEIFDDFKIFYDYESRNFIQKKIRKERILSVFSLAYVIIAIVFFIFISGKSDVLNFIKKSNNGDTASLADKIRKNEDSIRSLNKNLYDIKMEAGKFKDGNIPLAIYDKRMEKMEGDQKIIQDSIMTDPGKALSVRLIQEKQDALRSDTEDVKNAYINLNNKVDNIIIFVLVVPFIGLVYKLLMTNKKKENII